VRLEDDMHITENGAELFTPQSPSLEEPFGRWALSNQQSVHSFSNFADNRPALAECWLL